MIQNNPQQTAQKSDTNDYLPSEHQSLQSDKVLPTANIYISTDNSNLIQDKSNQGSSQLQQEESCKGTSVQKPFTSSLIYSPNTKINQSSLCQLHKNSQILNNSKKDQICYYQGTLNKCHNKHCLASATTKIRSKVNGRDFWLCQDCAYNSNQFCQFCQQINAQEQVDGMEWIKCQSQNCKQSDHTLCQQRYSNFSKQNLYFCTKCKTQNLQRPIGATSQLQTTFSGTNKRCIDDPYKNKISIFKSSRQYFGHLESMLTTYSYKLSLSQEQLRHQNIFLNFPSFSYKNKGYSGNKARSVKKRKYK